MIPGCQCDDLDLLRLKAPETAIFDEIVRVLMMAAIADVHPDVVQHGRVFQPLTFTVAHPVGGLRLVKKGQTETCHLVCVFRLVIATFCELDHAPTADVWILLDVRDPRLVLVDIVEGEPLS